MPSFISTILRSQIKLLAPIIANATLEQTRSAQDALSKLSQRAVRDSVIFKDVRFPLFDAAWAIPLNGRVRQAIIYLHGGSYNAGGVEYATVFGGLLAQMTNRAVMCVGYRLAPENPFPAALEDALTSYQAALERFAPQDIAFAGESAGGGLVYCLALKAKEMGLPQPERIVAISPWTDVTMTRDVSELQKLDLLIHRDNVKESAGMYVGGNDPHDPLISPLYGDLTGLPPSLIFVGSHEILLEDSVAMHEKLEQSGCTCELHIAEGMWHVYVLYGVPEAREALKRIALYLTGEKHRG